MAAIDVDSTEVVIPGTNFGLLKADYDSALDFPDNDTINYGDDWGSDWAPEGYTQGGIAVQLTRTLTDILFDQSIDPVAQLTTARDIRLRTVLGQATPKLLASATGYGSYVETPAGGGVVKPFNDFIIPANLPPIDYFAFGVEAELQSGEPLRVIAWRTQLVGSPTYDIKKDAAATIPFEARALPDTAGSNNRVITFRQILAA